MRFEAAVDEQDGMASGGGVVVVSGGNFSIFVSESDQFEELGLIFDLNFDKAIDEDLVVDLFEFEFLGFWWKMLWEDEKVHHFLVVDFKHWAWNHISILVSVKNLLSRIKEKVTEFWGWCQIRFSSWGPQT